jgi:hypothetical protein
MGGDWEDLIMNNRETIRTALARVYLGCSASSVHRGSDES